MVDREVWCRLTGFQAAHEPVEPREAGVRDGLSRLAPPRDDDVGPVLLVPDVGARERVELPVDAPGIGLERLLGLLVAQQRVERLIVARLDDVDVEGAVAVLKPGGRVEAEPQLLPGGARSTGEPEPRLPRRLLELADHLLGCEGRRPWRHPVLVRGLGCAAPGP